MAIDLVVAGERVVTPEGVRPAAVLVSDGRIAGVVNRDEVPEGAPGFDAGGLAVMPGLVDSHVHVNEPGRTEWEGFESATKSALAGGVTTIVDMPLHSIPPTTSVQAFEFKWEAAQGQVYCDAAFWGGLIPGNAGQLERMAEDGICGFKCRFAPAAVEDFPPVGSEELRAAAAALRRARTPLLFDAELPPSEAAAAELEEDPRRYERYLASRPASLEAGGVALAAAFCRETRLPVHICNLSTADALPEIEAAKAEGLPLTVETCPHYLTFAGEEVDDGRTDFKCIPPIRRAADREGLWRGLVSGAIDMVVSDHNPCVPSLKLLQEGDFGRAWGGVSSLQIAFPALWAQARRRGHGLELLALWCAQRPAALARLSQRKGRLAKGLDADIVVWDADCEFTLQPQMLRHRHKVTPYLGKKLRGMPSAVFLRGKKVFDNGAFLGGAQGELLKHD